MPPPPGSGDGGVEPVASAARGRLDAIRRALVAQMALLLSRLDQTGGGLASTKDALDTARRIRAQVLDLIREDSLPIVISAAEEAVADAVERALGTARSAAPAGTPPAVFTFDAEARDAIARSVNGVLDEVAVVFKDGAQAVRRAMDVGINTSAPLAELVRDVQARMDTTFARAQTVVDTAIRGAARMTLVRQAERGGEAAGEEMVYLWLGPVDSKTRPICRENAGKAFTLDALRRMDNEQGLPVEVYAGGFQCRHTLSPLSRADAEAEGITVVDT